MKRVFSLLIILLSFITFNVKADDNYEMYVPNCAIGNDADVYIPMEFGIRNEKVFDDAIEGKLLLLQLRENAVCSIDSYDSKLFDKIEIDDSNAIYGIFKSDYSDGGILEDVYQSAYVDGVFDYSKFGSSVVLKCTRDANIDNNLYYELNETYNHVVVGDELYCNYVNNLFDKGYTFNTTTDNATFSDVLVSGAKTATENPDILYLVLLVTLTLLFFFILLEVRRQNKYTKKRK